MTSLLALWKRWRARHTERELRVADLIREMVLEGTMSEPTLDSIRDSHQECRHAGEAASHCLMCGMDWPCDALALLCKLDVTYAALREVTALHVTDGRGCRLCSPQDGRAPCATRLICEEALR